MAATISLQALLKTCRLGFLTITLSLCHSALCAQSIYEQLTTQAETLRQQSIAHQQQTGDTPLDRQEKNILVDATTEAIMAVEQVVQVFTFTYGFEASKMRDHVQELFRNLRSIASSENRSQSIEDRLLVTEAFLTALDSLDRRFKELSEQEDVRIQKIPYSFGTDHRNEAQLTQEYHRARARLLQQTSEQIDLLARQLQIEPLPESSGWQRILERPQTSLKPPSARDSRIENLLQKLQKRMGREFAGKLLVSTLAGTIVFWSAIRLLEYHSTGQTTFTNHFGSILAALPLGGLLASLPTTFMMTSVHGVQLSMGMFEAVAKARDRQQMVYRNINFTRSQLENFIGGLKLLDPSALVSNIDLQARGRQLVQELENAWTSDTLKFEETLRNAKVFSASARRQAAEIWKEVRDQQILSAKERIAFYLGSEAVTNASPLELQQNRRDRCLRILGKLQRI